MKPISYIFENILIDSVKNDSYNIFVKKLFEHSSLINYENEKGETLLHFACFFGMIDKYYALINIGAVPTITKEGNNLLHYASFSGKDNFLIVELVKSKILPNATNNYKQTSLHFCANEQIAHYLNLWCIRNNVDVLNLLDEDNNNVVHSCKINGHQNVASYWIKNYPTLDSQLNDYGKNWKEVHKKYSKYC